MLLIELFDRDNILLPEWLSDEYLDDNWVDSTYSFNEEYHTWTLNDPFGKLRICFNGEKYHFQALSDDGEWIPFKTITEDSILIY